MEIPRWEENEGCVVRGDCMSCKVGDFRQQVEDNCADAGQVPYYEDYSEMPMMGGNQTGSNVDRMAILREFLFHVRLSASGHSSEMRRYIGGKVGL